MAKSPASFTDADVIKRLELICQCGTDDVEKRRALLLELKRAAIAKLQNPALQPLPLTLAWFTALMLEEPLQEFLALGADRTSQRGVHKATFALAWSKKYLDSLTKEERGGRSSSQILQERYCLETPGPIWRAKKKYGAYIDAINEGRIEDIDEHDFSFLRRITRIPEVNTPDVKNFIKFTDTLDDKTLLHFYKDNSFRIFTRDQILRFDSKHPPFGTRPEDMPLAHKRITELPPESWPPITTPKKSF